MHTSCYMTSKEPKTILLYLAHILWVIILLNTNFPINMPSAFKAKTMAMRINSIPSRLAYTAKRGAINVRALFDNS